MRSGKSSERSSAELRPRGLGTEEVKLGVLVLTSPTSVSRGGRWLGHVTRSADQVRQSRSRPESRYTVCLMGCGVGMFGWSLRFGGLNAAVQCALVLCLKPAVERCRRDYGVGYRLHTVL